MTVNASGNVKNHVSQIMLRLYIPPPPTLDYTEESLFSPLDPKQFFLLAPERLLHLPIVRQKNFPSKTKDYYLLETAVYRKSTDECCNYIKKNGGSLETERIKSARDSNLVARAGQHTDINFLRCTMKDNAR